MSKKNKKIRQQEVPIGFILYCDEHGWLKCRPQDAPETDVFIAVFPDLQAAEMQHPGFKCPRCELTYIAVRVPMCQLDWICIGAVVTGWAGVDGGGMTTHLKRVMDSIPICARKL